MQRLFDEPAIYLEHDHNFLTVLWEDLDAITRLALSPGNSHLLEDAAQMLRHLREEVLEHAGWEEKELFPLLQAKNPKLEERITTLNHQHEVMRTRLSELDGMLAALPEDLEKNGPDVIKQLEGLITLWEAHSQAEWNVMLDHMNPTTLLNLLENSPYHTPP